MRPVKYDAPGNLAFAAKECHAELPARDRSVAPYWLLKASLLVHAASSALKGLGIRPVWGRLIAAS